MRHAPQSIALFLVAGLAVACKPTEGTEGGRNHGGTAAEQGEKAKTETHEAGEAIRDYAYAEKTELVDKMNHQLAEIRERLDRLSVKVETSSGEARASARDELEGVREKWAQAKKQLDQSASATESTWDGAKRGFNESYGELKDSFERTRQSVGEKVDSP